MFCIWLLKLNRRHLAEPSSVPSCVRVRWHGVLSNQRATHGIHCTYGAHAGIYIQPLLLLLPLQHPLFTALLVGGDMDILFHDARFCDRRCQPDSVLHKIHGRRFQRSFIVQLHLRGGEFHQEEFFATREGQE